MIAKKDNALIKQYEILEGFVQVDYIDGFSYVDKAGEILNVFVRQKKEVPKFKMGLNGLDIADIDDIIPELKISASRLWIHFVDPKNLGNIHNKAEEIIKNVLDIIKPTMIERIGWRTYLAREGQQKKIDPLARLKITKGLSDFEVENFALKRKYDTYDLRLELSPLVKKSDPTKGAVLFDIDLGRKQVKGKPTIDYSEILADIHNKLKSKDLLESLEGVTNYE